MSEGRWVSRRTTHHLAMRRTELGQLEITASVLAANAPRVVEICEMHRVDPASAIGGAAVRWQGSMAWDEAGKTQEGDTVLVLVPDPEDSRKGLLLREKGYAETDPVAGRYWLDDQDGLVLTTEYATMNSKERFWFPNPDLRLRTSTVIGLSNTASFCVETRLPENFNGEVAKSNPPINPETLPAAYYSALGW